MAMGMIMLMMMAMPVIMIVAMIMPVIVTMLVAVAFMGRAAKKAPDFMRRHIGNYFAPWLECVGNSLQMVRIHNA